MALTTLQIKNAAPTVTDYTLTDASGLFMIVKPNGSKLWRFRYRREGKLRRLSLGTYPETSLAQARVSLLTKYSYHEIPIDARGEKDGTVQAWVKNGSSSTRTRLVKIAQPPENA